MYPRLIEVHLESGEPAAINVENIELIAENAVRGVSLAGNDVYIVKESYEELKKLISDSGCLVHKADPRIENTALTMDDLKEMIGAPVWNSNTGEWLLVYGVAKDGFGEYATFINCQNRMNFHRDDLKKFPLYRMKVQK